MAETTGKGWILPSQKLNTIIMLQSLFQKILSLPTLAKLGTILVLCVLVGFSFVGLHLATQNSDKPSSNNTKSNSDHAATTTPSSIFPNNNSEKQLPKTQASTTTPPVVVTTPKSTKSSGTTSTAKPGSSSSGTGSQPTTTTQITCSGSANTPGGADPWGGCFPGSGNTGVPAGTQLVAVNDNTHNPPNGTLLSDNTGWSYSNSDGYISVISSNAVIDGVSTNGGIYVPAGDSLTVKDSATGLINDEGASLDVEHSTIYGGTDLSFSSINGGSNIAVKYSNLSGGQHEVLCYSNCDIENNWLHDNTDGSAQGDHQNGFLSTGGSNFTILHNSVYCVGGCTADIAVLNQGGSNDATVSNNLLVASPMAAYCVYPGPDSDPASYASNSMVWTNNVFQKGTSGKCATYGPVYGWFPEIGTGDVWSGNIWDDGTPVTP